MDTGDFRIISRKSGGWPCARCRSKTSSLRGQISWIGYRQTFLEYDRAERAGGRHGLHLPQDAALCPGRHHGLSPMRP
ncbi:MAG: hypothetical protein WKG07_22520 [Hymenobacter sp.]